jgi:hypothetical protein
MNVTDLLKRERMIVLLKEMLIEKSSLEKLLKKSMDKKK